MEKDSLLHGQSPIKNHFDALRKEIIELVFERDQLKYTICENIKARYIREYGELEYRVYKAYCDFLRLGRKKDYIQAKINRQEKVNLEVIENQLDLDFEQFQKSLKEKLKEFTQAIERGNLPFLNDEDDKELKRLYKSLVKKLHPDLNPNQSEEEAQFFMDVVSAFKSGDLKTLKLIEFLYQEGVANQAVDSMGIKISFEQEKERLEAIRQEIKDEIEAIKQKPPYILQKLLSSNEIIKQKKESLKHQLASYQEAIKTQKEAIKDLLGNANA